MNNTIKPWANEPNYLIWTDEETGYLCLIKRLMAATLPISEFNPFHLCGYVLVSKDHPASSYNFDDYSDEAIDFNVHGGITFSSQETILVSELPLPNKDYTWTMHIPENMECRYNRAHQEKECFKELASGFMVGFDCAHSGDISRERDIGKSDCTYKNIYYVKAQCTSLAKQLHNMMKCSALFAEVLDKKAEVKEIKKKIKIAVEEKANE